MRAASIASVLFVLTACGGDRSASSRANEPAPTAGEPPATAGEPPAPAPVAADEACRAAGRADVTAAVARPPLALAAGGAVAADRPLVLLPDEVGERWAAGDLATVGAVAPTLTYRQLDDASQAALRELGDDTLLQVIRDAQAARGARVIGRFAFIMNYGLVLDGAGAIRAVLEDAVIAEPADVAACASAILAR